MNRREVFFIADDFGWSRDVNAAILDCHRTGALHGASLMMGQSGTADAVALAQANPRLQIGWHLHLCNSQPLTRPEWPWGRSYSRAGWSIGLSPASWRLMRRELAEQWKQFLATGLPCAFINAHHHLHVHPLVFRELRRIVPADWPAWWRLGRPMRFGSGAKEWWDHLVADCHRRSPWPSSDTFWGVDRLYAMNAAEIRAAIAALPPGRHEFMFHPRTVGDPDGVALRELR